MVDTAADRSPGREPILVSACLLGLPTRYDGASKRSQTVLDWLAHEGLTPVPVCPEQLAGLPTPREQTRFASGDGHTVIAGSGEVRTISGRIMNDPFLHGARATLQIARLTGCRRALLKERSPSCGVHRIHRENAIVDGSGVTAALLIAAGLAVLSEADLPAPD
ncbi:MAG: DUF523 domain-containing protein [Deltaproteobacteria bacterium]|nr:MAG: DUF523 domain-containing protein [Deltaproteobacteria bacterium]